MRELLTRWAELEPERCKPTQVADFCIFDREERRNYYIYFNDPEMFDQIDHIQGLVQKAIVARGWGFELNNVRLAKGSDAPAIMDTVNAIVYAPKDGTHFNTWSRAPAETTAEALLAAYVEMLGDEKPKEGE